jgi:hypothetical protein
MSKDGDLPPQPAESEERRRGSDRRGSDRRREVRISIATGRPIEERRHGPRRSPAGQPADSGTPVDPGQDT